MEDQNKQNSHLSVAEAVDTLTEIADMDMDTGQEMGFSREQNPEDVKQPHGRAIQWLNNAEPEKCLRVAKETFRVILNYLRKFYRDRTVYVSNDPSFEGIKAIMVLVGEAAKKLDRYIHSSPLMNGKSVLELKEYKKLQEFYQSKVAHNINIGRLGEWILALTNKPKEIKQELGFQASVQQAKHVFVDLDSVKDDSEYELFFLRKEDGSRYFSPRLLRNMKLVGDFEAFFGKEEMENPLAEVHEWMDKYYQYSALRILQEIGNLKDRFFGDIFKHKDNELVHDIGSCLMALMMCSNSRNSIRITHLKNCEKYFRDFQVYLRHALHTREYAKLVAYPPRANNKTGICLQALVHLLCRGLYMSCHGYREIVGGLEGLLESMDERKTEEQRDEKFLWKQLKNDYEMFKKMFKGRQNASLVKILDSLQEGNCNSFDPLLQKTMQARLYELSYDNHKILNVRMGCPTVQEYVNKALVNDEFKAFLRGCTKETHPKNLLFINLQDRTSWREHARCAALEELQNHEGFDESFAVATIARETDFAYQLSPYDQDNKVDVFFDHFKAHFGDESSGYYFPKGLKGVLSEEFFEGLFNGVHQVFFSGKNMLLRDPRLDFIEIFDALLILKIIETAKPDSVCLLCKDGVDSSASMNAFLYCLLKLTNSPDPLSEEEWLQLNSILYLPAMMVRERLIQYDVFSRFISALKTVENVKQELGGKEFVNAFHKIIGPLFKTSILKSTCSLYA